MFIAVMNCDWCSSKVQDETICAQEVNPLYHSATNFFTTMKSYISCNIPSCIGALMCPAIDRCSPVAVTSHFLTSGKVLILPES